MSKQKLLSENTVRRFMRLASIPSLSDSFVRENYSDIAGAREDEEELPPEDAMAAEPAPEDPAGDVAMEPAPADDELAGDEMEDEFADDELADDEMEDELEGDMSLSREEAEVLIDLGKRLEAVMSGEEGLGAEEEPPEGDLEEPPMGDEEPPMDAEAPPEGVPPAPGELGAEEEEEEEEEPLEESRRRQQIVDEVLKRVTKRIIKAKSKR